MKNKTNREQMKYSTTQATKSLVAIRHEKVNPNYIEQWKEYHWTKKNKSFANEEAELNYEKLKLTLEAETQQTVDSATDDSSSVDQLKRLSKVLGERQSYPRGAGRKLKGKTSTYSSQNTQSQAPPQKSPEEIADLVNMVKMMNEQNQYLHQQHPPTNKEMQDQTQRFYQKYVGLSSESHIPHTPNYAASASAPASISAPASVSASALALPSQPQWPSQPLGYLYPWLIPPYPYPQTSGSSSQPHIYPYPYMYGTVGASFPTQYPCLMPPHTSQPPQAQEVPEKDYRDRDRDSDSTKY